MSELVRLGAADASDRWIGVRRHQAVLVVVGLVLVGDAIMRTRSLVEGVLGVVAALGAVSAFDGLTLAELLVAALHYGASSKWRALSALQSDGDVALWAGGDVALRGYELEHRGRLDLSGLDAALAAALAALADAASATRAGQHLSLHVYTLEGRVTTLLALPVGVTAPHHWSVRADLVLRVMGLRDEDPSLRVRERWSYLRSPYELVRVYRVRDFSSVPAGRALLEQFLRAATPQDLALHVDVVAGDKAHRLAARAVHRLDSDDVTTRSAGFRRNARTARHLERLREREALVAAGRSLLRLGVYVTVRATSLEALQRHSATTWRAAHDAGLRLERGGGRQAAWYFAQLPGGVGW